jgi:co-chaperonin GroES (HSP10)
MKVVKQVIGDKLLVKKINASKRSVIFLPQETTQKSFLGIISMVGSNIKDKETLCPERVCLFNSFNAIKIKEYDQSFFKESDVILIKKGVNYHPFGQRVLISRLNNTEVFKSGIIIPTGYQSSDQTLFGVVFSKGIANNNIIDTLINIGDIVKIEKWSEKIIEVDIDGNSYLSVPVSMIQFSCSEETFKENYVKN